MHIMLETDDPRPVFKQIVDEVQRCVATGILRQDDPLPAVRELAKQLKVNPNTVQQAYRELERSGGAYVRRGVGTFVAHIPRGADARRSVLARQIAGKFLREGFRHGLLASDLLAALQEIAPGAPTAGGASASPPSAERGAMAASTRQSTVTAPPREPRLGFDG